MGQSFTWKADHIALMQQGQGPLCSRHHREKANRARKSAKAKNIKGKDGTTSPARTGDLLIHNQAL
jgi:hypothetical protein